MIYNVDSGWQAKILMTALQEENRDLRIRINDLKTQLHRCNTDRRALRDRIKKLENQTSQPEE